MKWTRSGVGLELRASGLGGRVGGGRLQSGFWPPSPPPSCNWVETRPHLRAATFPRPVVGLLWGGVSQASAIIRLSFQ